MIKTVIEILKEKPFVWIVLFVGFGILLFSPLIALWSNNLIVAETIAWLRITFGIVWVISGVAILYHLIAKTTSFIKIKFLENRTVKEIANLSYQEKLLLYIPAILKLPIVPVSNDNKIALILVEKGILNEPNPFFSRSPLGERFFGISSHIWVLLISEQKQVIIFKEFLGKKAEDLIGEYDQLRQSV